MFDLIEYSMDIDLPDFVVEHPVIKALNQGANDLVTVSIGLLPCNRITLTSVLRRSGAM